MMNERIIFWNVDSQYDFMSPMGALSVENAMKIAGNLKLLTDMAERNQIKVVNTADSHDENTAEISETPDFKTTFPAHCMKGTKGMDYIAQTKPRRFARYFGERAGGSLSPITMDIVIHKDVFDCFGNENTDTILSLLNPDKVVIYGVTTQVCVNFAVLGILDRGYDVIVVQDAIKELPDWPHEPFLEDWESKGAKFMITKEVLDEVRTRP